MRCFEGFRASATDEKMIWQESSNGFSFTCSICGRDFKGYTHRWIGSPIQQASRQHGTVLCDDCKAGRDPNRGPIPVYSQRRKSLD